MTTSLVITVLGLDRPGLVELIADTAAQHKANWEASRMARLGERFAGIVLLAVEEARAGALEAALAGLRARGLTIVVERGSARPAAAGAPGVTLALLGPDRPGIVRELTALLAAREVNVEELHTELASAPMSGEPVFKLRATLRLPPSLAASTLATALKALPADLMVDLG